MKSINLVFLIIIMVVTSLTLIFVVGTTIYVWKKVSPIVNTTERLIATYEPLIIKYGKDIYSDIAHNRAYFEAIILEVKKYSHVLFKYEEELISYIKSSVSKIQAACRTYPQATVVTYMELEILGYLSKIGVSSLTSAEGDALLNILTNVVSIICNVH